ncbi:MAG: hypothetical protein ACRD1T_25905 [Acidimicrobiia bacterium]
MLALVCGMAVGIHAQRESGASKPEVPLVSVVGCASRAPDGTWMLINATAGTETRQVFSSTKEIDEAKKQKPGSNRYRLMGTTDFLSKEELLKDEVRRQFTRPEVANATGQLQNGKKLVVKGLLITAPNEKRLNLVSVQQLSDTCK